MQANYGGSPIMRTATIIRELSIAVAALAGAAWLIIGCLPA